MTLTEEKQMAIEEEATKRFKKWNQGGVNGQMVRSEQFYDYWIMQVAYEFGQKDTSSDGDYDRSTLDLST